MKIFQALSRSLLPFLPLVGGGALVATFAVTFVVSIWHDVTLSGWNITAAQIARWFAFWIGVYLIHNLLPIAVAHGRTRREYLWQAALFAVLAGATLAVTARIGFLLETWLYQAMDWSRTTAGNGFLEYWLMFMVWIGAGAFIAAAFGRYEGGGLLAIPIGIVLILPAGSLVSGSNSLPFIGTLPSTGQAVLVTAGAIVVAFGLAWSIARDMPIRAKAA